MKTYNKLPHPLSDFALALAGFSLAAFGFWATAWPSLREDVSINANSIASTFGFGPLDVDFLLALSLGAGSVILAAAITLSGYRNFHNGAWAGPKPSPDRSYGNSRIISSPLSLQRRFKAWRRGKRSQPGLVVGGIGASRNRLLVAPIQNALIIGGTGSGKTTSALAPSQIALIESETPVSTFTLDPKGELYSLTARHAEKSGAKVVMIDFSDSKTSDGWLPLQPAIDCAKGVNGRSPDEMPAEIRILASTLIPDRHDSSPIWTNAARILFSGLSAFVASSERVPDKCRNLSTVAALASMPQETLQKITEELPIGSSARQQLSAVAFAPAETFGGFATNLNAALDPYADPSVSPMLSHSDYRPEDFAKGRVCLYVKFNGGSTALDALVSTFVSQTLETLRRVAERECGGRLPYPVYCLFEEFAQLPKIDGMQKHVSIVRGAGVRMVFVAQDRAQIESVYRSEAPAIFNNLDTTLFLASNDLKTCKHYSEALGSYTVETVQNSRTRGANTGSSTQSRTLHEARLFRPEDLAKWDWRAGHLIIDRGHVYACSSLPLSKTFAGDLIGLDGEEADAAKLAQMRPERPVKNHNPAPVWAWQGNDEATVGEIAAAISGVGDPRFM